MGCPVAYSPYKIQSLPQIVIHQIVKILCTHKAHQLVLVRHLQRLIHRIHPLDGKLHGSAAIDDTGFLINLKYPFRRNGHS